MIFILTIERKPGYKEEHVDEEFIKQNIDDFGKHFYVCGPDPMVIEISATLKNTGAETESVVFEK